VSAEPTAQKGRRARLGVLHRTAATVAYLTITTFLLATLTVEAFGTEADVRVVKRLIAAGLFLLVPAMATAGATGSRFGARSPLALAKLRRMKFVAANGVGILTPCAIALWRLSDVGRFDALFTAIQLLEVVAGLVNVTLMSLMIRDGMRLSGRLRTRPTSTEPRTS
jgi:hypothetical protein